MEQSMDQIPEPELKKTYKVCIIDDDDIYQFTITRTIQLTNLAQEVLVFSDGEQALEYFREHAGSENTMPDIILVDINMPIMNGWEFVEKFEALRSNITKDIKIYMSSSSIDSRDIEKAQQIQCVSDYLVKPMTISKIKDIMSELN